MKRVLVNDDLLASLDEIRGSTLFNHAVNKCRLDDSLSFVSMLQPILVEASGCILIKEFYNGDINSLKEHFSNNKEIESFVNCWSISELFESGGELYQRDLLVEKMGEVLQYYWTIWLNENYPEKDFIVELGQELHGENGLAITFYQQNNTHFGQ